MSYIEQDLAPQARGDTWILRFVIQDSSGTAIDITGNQYWITLKNNVNEADPGVLQVGPVVAVAPDSAQGIIEITVPSLNTDSLNPNKSYYYDLQEVTSSNIVSTLLIGKIRVKADVTRVSDFSGTSTVVSSVAGTAVYSGETTTTSATEIFLNGLENNRLSVEDESILSFDALVAGRDNTTGDACSFQLYGAIKKDTTTTEIIGSVGKNILGEDAVGFDANITADDANDALKIEVTAATTNNTKWSAVVQYTTVSF